MNSLRAIAVMSPLIAVCAHAAHVEPSLPVWNESERKTQIKEGWIAGGVFLIDDAVIDDGVESEPDELESMTPTPDEIAEPKVPFTEVPQSYWSEYFDQKPKSFLIDPQGLLSATEYQDRLAFLNYHASDSSVDLYVYVFKGDQDIPGEVREEELIERFFSSGRPAVVVYYFMSAPQLSVIYLSSSMTDAVPNLEQRQALENSVMQAVAKPDSPSQLEAFLVQLSIRIYWIERMMGGGVATGETMPLTVYKTKPTKKKSDWMNQFLPVIEQMKPAVPPVAGGVGLLVTGVLATCWIRRRSRNYFPEIEVEPRLGGEHAAGIGAVISFVSAAVPPASQRDQVPDYLRRY